MTEKSRRSRFNARRARQNWMSDRPIRRRYKKWGIGTVVSDLSTGRIFKVPSYQPYDPSPLFRGEIGILEGVRML